MIENSTRFSFGGDEHLLCECSEEMSLQSFFKSLSATTRIKQLGIPGVVEVCGGNAAYLVRFNPDEIHPDDLLERIKEIDEEAAKAELPPQSGNGFFAATKLAPRRSTSEAPGPQVVK